MNSGALQRTNDRPGALHPSPGSLNCRLGPSRAHRPLPGAIQMSQDELWRPPEDTDYSLEQSRGAWMNFGAFHRTQTSPCSPPEDPGYTLDPS